MIFDELIAGVCETDLFYIAGFNEFKIEIVVTYGIDIAVSFYIKAGKWFSVGLNVQFFNSVVGTVDISQIF